MTSWTVVLWPLLLLCTVLPADTTSTSKNNVETYYDFDKMSSLIKRLDVIEQSAPDTLMGFYEPRLKSFSVKPGSVGSEKRVCVTSTCYALLTLALCSGVYKETTDSKQIPIRKVIRTLLHSEWREDDIFQVPLLIYTILRVDTDRSLIRSAASKEDIASRIKRLLSAVLKASPQRLLGARQLHSDYISYQVCKVAALLHESSNLKKGTVGGLPANVLPDDVDSDIFWVLLSCAEVSANQLCRQLAYRSAGDSSSFDVVRLAYSLLTYIKSTDSLSGIAGRELVAGQGPSPETKVAQLNQRLVAAGLAAYFQEQNDNGMWNKGQPIYKSFTGGQGRNFENAFVFPVNTVGSLLCALPAEHFRSHLGALEKTLAWIESHDCLEVITDYCDPESGECYGKPLRGWSSPHLSPDAGPQAWPTAQVLKCVSWMRTAISQLMHNDVLQEFNGISFSNTGTRSAGWDRLLDTDIGNPNSEEGCRTIKDVLEERVIKPFEISIDNPSYGAAYSAILFGPPGGAKTTICEALAQKMGYDFVVIDTATFLADGLSNVAARIRYVFTRLMALKKCVILFDEIEEFVLDRENPGLSMESRMLTTAMLTAINDLRRNKKSVFFVATNRLRAFDSAITRPGRFDMQLFVGTPNLDSRVIQLQQQLTTSGVVDEKVVSRAVESYRSFLQSVWSQDAMFMNFLEGVQFASACAKIVKSNAELTTKEMSSILHQQAAVMTVRGSAREEYIASMELSRV